VVDLECHKVVSGGAGQESPTDASDYLTVAHDEVHRNDHWSPIGSNPDPTDEFEVGRDGEQLLALGDLEHR